MPWDTRASIEGLRIFFFSYRIRRVLQGVLLYCLGQAGHRVVGNDLFQKRSDEKWSNLLDPQPKALKDLEGCLDILQSGLEVENNQMLPVSQVDISLVLPLCERPTRFDDLDNSVGEFVCNFFLAKPDGVLPTGTFQPHGPIRCL